MGLSKLPSFSDKIHFFSTKQPNLAILCKIRWNISKKVIFRFFINAHGEVYINSFELLEDGGDLNINQVLSCMYKTVVVDCVILVKGQSMTQKLLGRKHLLVHHVHWRTFEARTQDMMIGLSLESVPHQDFASRKLSILDLLPSRVVYLLPCCIILKVFLYHFTLTILSLSTFEAKWLMPSESFCFFFHDTIHTYGDWQFQKSDL